LKPGSRIHDLFVIVQKSDGSYCPKLVDIRFCFSAADFLRGCCFVFCLHDTSRRTAETDAAISAASPIRMDFDGLMQSNGFSAINILPKHFNQAHRVLEFNVEDSHGGCECYVRGFIARTMVITEAKANSSGLIVGRKTDKSGEILLFRPFSGAPQDNVFEVSAAAHNNNLTSTHLCV
jgi:hypothetical protein